MDKQYFIEKLVSSTVNLLKFYILPDFASQRFEQTKCKKSKSILKQESCAEYVRSHVYWYTFMTD